MSEPELLEEITIEASAMRRVLSDLAGLLETIGEREANSVEKAAAGAFLAQLYGGMENILKRFCRHRGVLIPEGPHWHRDLITLFEDESISGLPRLFDSARSIEMDEYRRFRHLFVHGYTVLIDWPRLRPLAEAGGRVFEAFLSAALGIAGAPGE